MFKRLRTVLLTGVLALGMTGSVFADDHAAADSELQASMQADAYANDASDEAGEMQGPDEDRDSEATEMPGSDVKVDSGAAEMSGSNAKGDSEAAEMPDSDKKRDSEAAEMPGSDKKRDSEAAEMSGSEMNNDSEERDLLIEALEEASGLRLQAFPVMEASEEASGLRLQAFPVMEASEEASELRLQAFPVMIENEDEDEETAVLEPEELPGIEGFVTRLYNICLERDPDNGGYSRWVGLLRQKIKTGTDCAYGFIFCTEFTGKNYCNSCFVRKLYLAIMGREPDTPGMNDWVSQLESGKTREAVFNGFIGSVEFKQLCQRYGVDKGDPIAIPSKGTIAIGTCMGCNKTDDVAEFVKRLYRCCLGRGADAGGLKDWCEQLRSRKATGTKVAYGFFFSTEFLNKNHNDENYVTYLYNTFLDRGPDPSGKAYWLKKLADGETRLYVFNGFAQSKEFDGICRRYGITR